MPAEPAVAAKSEAYKWAMILYIDQREEGGPLQFPAVIRNLVNGLATLEVTNPWTILNWETLKGQGGGLRLLGEKGQITELRGTISWARYSVQGQDSGKLSLCLEIDNLDPSSRKLLTENIPFSGRDIKGFWDQWDQTQDPPARKPPELVNKFSLAAMVLLVAGLVLQLSHTPVFKIFGLLLWCGGTLGVAWQAFQFWKNRKASR